MDQQTGIQAMLYVAAALQVAAAVVALLLAPISGMHRSWLLICAALIIQAWRRIVAVTTHGTLFEATTALAVSILMLVGIVSIRAVFISMRKSKRLLDRQADGGAEVSNRAGAAIAVIDPDGCVRNMNEATRSLLLWEGRSIAGVDWFDTFVPPEQREERRRAFRRLLAAEGDGDEYVELALMDAEGGEHSLVWHRRVLRDAEGNVTGVRVAGVNISDGGMLEEELAFRSMLLDHTTDSIIAYRPDGTVVYANDTASAYRGRTRNDLVGTDVREIMHPRDRDAFDIHLETVQHGSCVVFETEAVDGEGLVRPLESRVCPIVIGSERLVVDVARDITERREAESAIRRLAYTDHLTGLPNRVLLSDRSSVALARARRDEEMLALLFMDLDRVKQVNDTLGHAAGDELLRQVGKRLAETFRGEDTVARIGGDEFVVFLRVEDVADAEKAAARLVDLVAEPFAVGGDEVCSSASVGIALFPEDGETLDDLIAKADAAMYAAKEQGRSRYWRLARQGPWA